MKTSKTLNTAEVRDYSWLPGYHGSCKAATMCLGFSPVVTTRDQVKSDLFPHSAASPVDLRRCMFLLFKNIQLKTKNSSLS